MIKIAIKAIERQNYSLCSNLPFLKKIRLPSLTRTRERCEKDIRVLIYGAVEQKSRSHFNIEREIAAQIPSRRTNSHVPSILDASCLLERSVRVEPLLKTYPDFIV